MHSEIDRCNRYDSFSELISRDDLRATFTFLIRLAAHGWRCGAVLPLVIAIGRIGLSGPTSGDGTAMKSSINKGVRRDAVQP